MYCTWSHRNLLPPALRDRFRDLDQFLKELLSSAESRVVIVAPYLSPAGLDAIRGPLAVAADRGAWLRLVTGDLQDPDGWNRRALRALVEGPGGDRIRGRLRVLTGSAEMPALLHAKFAVVDRHRGYLGSANLSWSAMEANFEVGTALASRQAEALDGLVAYLESQSFLVEATRMALGD